MNTVTTPKLSLLEVGRLDEGGLESFSPFCLKVHRALKLKRLPYVRVHADRPDAHKKYNFTGQVPVLLVDGAPVADSTTILRRIEELSSPFDAGLDARGRAEAAMWEELADTSLNGFVVAARWADDENWERYREALFGRAPAPVRWLVAPRVRARVVGSLRARDVWRRGPESCWQRFRATLDALDERAPERGFWLGDQVGLGDLGLFAQLKSLETSITPRQAEELRARERLHQYLSRVDRATTLS
jgi:glutathione S-transferase